MEYEIKARNKLTLGLKELWQYRELFYFFTWRDVKVKYKQTALGFAWAVLQPFMMMVIFTLFFGHTLKVPSESMEYPVFVFSGLLLWNLFSSGLSNAGTSMITNANILKKIYFPRLIIPISAILVSLFDFLMAFIIFIGILIYYKTDVDLARMLICLPVSLLITCIATFGLGTLLAALNIKYKDFRYIIPFMIQAFLFVTPVIYPVSIISQNWIKYILACNPIYSAIELFRYSIIDKPLEPTLLMISIVSAIIFFFAGLFYFRKTEFYFADLA